MKATVYNSISQYLALALALAMLAFAIMTTPAFASHPGEGRDGTVPQGPHKNACENQGEEGVDEAIERGGAVHCEEEGSGGPGGCN